LLEHPPREALMSIAEEDCKRAHGCMHRRGLP
jgi:hypothetical protein